MRSFIDDFAQHLDIRVIRVDADQKTWINPCVPYNIGLQKASGDIIIIQNPEVMHVGDCIGFAVENLKENDWLSLNCYGAPDFAYNETLKQKTDLEKFDIITVSDSRIGGNSVGQDDVGGWLNHYENHFVAYHYFAAIHKRDLIEKMDSGFNEVLQNGVGCDDDEFIKRLIWKNFNFTIPTFEKTKPFVIHLFHEKLPHIIKSSNKSNIELFNKECVRMEFEPQNDIQLAPVEQTPMGHRTLL